MSTVEMANQSACDKDDCTNCTLDYSIHQTLFPTVYIAVFVIGLPTNLLSLYHSYLQIRQRNELGIYLCNLTISDLLHLACFPLWIQYLLMKDNWVNGELLCRFTGIVLYENIYVSIAFLCCISIDRYLALVHPLRFHTFRTLKAVLLVSTLIWIKEIGTSLFIFTHHGTVKDRNNHLLCFEHYPLQSWQRRINYYRLSVGFLFPIVLLAFSYRKVLISIRESQGIQQSQKLRIKKLVLSAIVICCICFAPYHIMLLIRTLSEDTCNFARSSFHYYHIGLLLTSLNCVADPILYCFVSESTHGILRQLLEPLVNRKQKEGNKSSPISTPEI
ncbi:ovarian cancer G-protein coupled receptor 1-like [Carcharodon carcharias]|uniref:ovarian cancer G-protein coupled receptor 1-like n=1 Tax=Carcharodon carcharias TaxID=13397 RepID=UPI001B7DB59B|nr:ovarian cancer G-protein coupled receptor 1-like [Carcharodon carcharias]